MGLGKLAGIGRVGGWGMGGEKERADIMGIPT
jgi:hypothetical protein